MAEKDIPQDYRAYTIFESPEERMLRLEIKYYTSLIKNSEEPENVTIEHMKTLIQKFRRLKFRMEKRHKKTTVDELAFPEHYALGDVKEIEQ